MINLPEILRNAFRHACAKPTVKSPEGKRNAERSSNWILFLAEEFKKCYQERIDRGEVAVFSRPDGSNKDKFGFNEFLFDIAVCEIETVPSHHLSKELHYIKKALWLIESEFSKNGTDIVKDFSKLNLGMAENKLYIGSRTYRPEDLCLMLSRCATCTDQNLSVALIDHPDKWDSTDQAIDLRKFEAGKWQKIGC